LQLLGRNSALLEQSPNARVGFSLMKKTGFALIFKLSTVINNTCEMLVPV
jgi:hypothetical protein